MRSTRLFSAKPVLAARRGARLVLVLGCAMFAATGLQAASAQSVLQGNVKGVDGRAAKGAEVRIERQDRKGSPVLVRTDSTGNFIAKNLGTGRYLVTAKGAGGVTSPVETVNLGADRPVMISFDLRGTVAGKSATGGKKKKKYVWVPEETGSHLGGRYVEVDDDSDTVPSAQNVQRANTKSLERIQNSGANQSMGSGSR
ncbi:MAG: carboxypeptidase-like regulatory domain-containing protein [Chthoniobacterales bacterium]